VFTLGVGLLAVSFLISAYVTYSLTNSSVNVNFQTIELEMAMAQLFLALGVLVASTGWVFEKRVIARVLGFSTRSGPTTRRLVGQIVVLLGALIVAGATLYFSIIEFAVSYNVTLNLPNWTLSLIYTLEGVGVLAVAVGWWVQRSGSTVDTARAF
jgi:hypothetical protein